MDKKYQVQIFGKQDCQKCKVLKERIDKLLADEEWKDFEKKYFDVETEAGLIAFSEAECINPQRIPAMIMARREGEEAESYELIPSRNPGKEDNVCQKSKLFQYLGLQTDYATGGGVITPKMITAILGEARA